MLVAAAAAAAVAAAVVVVVVVNDKCNYTNYFRSHIAPERFTDELRLTSVNEQSATDMTAADCRQCDTQHTTLR